VIILGIDPGTAIVGYGIIKCEKNRCEVLDYGCIYTDKVDNMPKRLSEIYSEVENLIKLYSPDYVAVEELFFFKNNKTIITVGQARGVILLAAEKNNIKIAEYTPLQVKMGITGYGRAKKEQVQEMVKIVLGLNEIPKPDDAADALAIAVTHLHSIKNTIYTSFKNENKEKNIPSKEKEFKKNTTISNFVSLEEYKKMIQ